MRNAIKILTVLTGIFLLSFPSVWGDPGDLLSVENKFIKIYINASSEETGRFAVDTTEGDPARQDDNNKPLIYGHPKPWTSFTTVRIDDQNYVFGQATTKRSGAGLPGGEIVEPPHLDGNRIVMSCRYGRILVEQSLDIIQSPSTGALDTARIKYVCKNQGDTAQEVGIRLLLDTMIGANDGAPFRVGEHEVTTDYALERKDLPDFWQAFDSLDKPAVIAQSTLKGGEVTPPDRLVFTNWGKAADNPWNFSVDSGSDFTRQDEDELDSAAVMYWQPRKVAPGQQFTVVAYYGIGGITFAPGNTYLGISAPSEVEYNSAIPRRYTIVVYMEHRGEANAKNVKVNLDLPLGMDCVSGNQTIVLPEVPPGVTKQFAWEVKTNGTYQGDSSFQISVTGDGLESNQVIRKVKIIGPPLLTAMFTVPQLKRNGNAWEPNPIPVNLAIQNIGQSAAAEVKASLVCENGLRLADGERSEKFLGDLGLGQKGSLGWQIVPNRGFEKGSYKITITGLGTLPLVIPGSLEIPVLPVRVEFGDPGILQKGQVICCDVIARNLTNVAKFKFNLKYDPQKLRLVNVSRGLFSVENDQFAPWQSGKIDSKNGVVANIAGSRSAPFSGEYVTLARLNFIVVGDGDGEIGVNGLTLSNGQGKDVPVETNSLKYSIEGVQQ